MTCPRHVRQTRRRGVASRRGRLVARLAARAVGAPFAALVLSGGGCALVLLSGGGGALTLFGGQGGLARVGGKAAFRRPARTRREALARSPL